MNRLKQKYIEQIAPKLIKDFNLANVMQVPSIVKITVNAGIGPFRENREAVESFVTDFTNITGQKPSTRKANKSIAGFKIRENDVVGYTVTLRGERMWAFLDKLLNVALPRVRDFRGLNDLAFDDAGNYSMGIREHVIFPEVNANAVKGIRSLQITVGVKNGTTEMNKVMLKSLGFPFRKDEN